jgi:translation initiation factor 1 (eIF-1/SUI1)
MTLQVVSILSGLEPYGVEPREVARAFQRQFACSASISAAAGRSNVKEVMVQGNWAAELEGHLVSVIGVPKSLITVKMGKGVKAKKR